MRARAVFEGFRFGMMLQLAVGPVCLFVLHCSSVRGFGAGEAAVAAVTIVDGLYILAAVVGLGAALRRKPVAFAVKWLGAAVLCLFGLDLVLSVFGVPLLPGLSPAAGVGGRGVFAQALLLTASNPLTILFWIGVFSGRVAHMGAERRGLVLFGLGAVLSTAAFLSAVAALGSVLGAVLSPVVVSVLNGVVGAALIGFGIRLPFAAKSKGSEPTLTKAD